MRKYEESKTYEIPEEWKEKIYRGGWRRKVILYSANMVSSEYMRMLLYKIKNVIEYLEESDDALLLWRPDSLLNTMLAIESGKLLEEYEELVERFRKSANGIVDDTPDLYRAINISDAYFGDETSLLSLYRKTGKPILLQSISNNMNTRNIGNLYTESIVWEGDRGWFFHENYNGLFEAAWESRTCRYLASVPGEEMCKPMLYVAIAKYKDFLVLAPFMAEEIAIYDIGRGSFRKIALKKYDSENMEEKFADMVCYGKYIFLIPTCYPAVVRLDMETLELTYLEECIEMLEGYRANDKYLLNTRPVVWQETFWIGCYAANYLLEFNMETFRFSLHKIENCQGGITGSCYDGTVFWIVQYPQFKIISWNPITGEEKIFDRYPEGFHGGVHPFLYAFYDGSRVLLLPEHANMVLEINPSSGCMRGRKRGSVCQGEDNRMLYWTYFSRDNENYYIMGDGRIVRLDMHLHEEEVFRLQINQEEIGMIAHKMSHKMSKAMLAGEILTEDSEATDEKVVMESYIRNIALSSAQRIVKEEDVTNGKKIYEYIKEYTKEGVQ